VTVSGLGIVLLLVGGMAVLTAGAEALVRGATRLALLAGISPLVVGLTVVAWGTSTPELVVSVRAGLAGSADITVGNVVGSNVFNVLVVLGLSGLVAPLAAARQVIRFEVPIMIAASLLVWAMARDGQLGTGDGLLLLGALVAYTGWTVRTVRRGRRAGPDHGDTHLPREPREVLAGLALVGAGLAMLVVGGGWFVDGAVALARSLGVSEVVIGLTVVAAGTSLPEAATSLVATLRGQRDIAVGNAIGSSIYNLLAILGVSSLLTPGGLAVAPSLLAFDLPVMVATAVTCLPVFLAGASIARTQGATFLGLYVAYAAYLVLEARQHDALPAFSAVMLWFVIPLVALGIGVSLWRQIRPPVARRGA